MIGKGYPDNLPNVLRHASRATAINRRDVFSVQVYNRLMLLLIILGFRK